MHPVTLVLGGARSGKSSYAQRLAGNYARVLFLATATRSDEEIADKIERHQADRVSAGLASWTVVEEPLDLAGVIEQQGSAHDLALIDCLTFYAAHLLPFAESARASRMDALLRCLAAPPCHVVLVSNEVGSGVVPEYASGRQFRDLLGEINQRVAAVASDVLLMVAGLPLRLKGQAGSSQEMPLS